MTEKNTSFEELVSTTLQKSFAFSSREIQAFLTILAALIGNPSFSLRKVAQRSNGQFSRQYLTNVLKKYAFVQNTLAKDVVAMTVQTLKHRQKISLLIDDTLVKKRGNCIFSAFLWYDHCQNRVVRSICLINLALAVDNQLVFILPWMLLGTKRWHYNPLKRNSEQDRKTSEAIAMIDLIITWLVENSIVKTRILVIADAWFSNRQFINWLRQIKVDFRIDARTNYSVQQPDFDAISREQQPRRGRKRTRFVKYCSLVKYFGSPLTWAYFTDSDTGRRVYHKQAIVTLKTTGRVRVYALWDESRTTPKFLLTPAKLAQISTSHTVYLQYQARWRIEEAHRDMKQHFGLTKCQNRDGWVVSGFIGFIGFVYSLWKLWGKKGLKALKCPSWSEEFHTRQIICRYVAMGG